MVADGGAPELAYDRVRVQIAVSEGESNHHGARSWYYNSRNIENFNRTYIHYL